MNKFEASTTVDNADHGPDGHGTAIGNENIVSDGASPPADFHDTGAVIDSIIQTLSGTADVGHTAVFGNGFADAAMHDVGNIVSEASQFHAGGTAGSSDLAAADHGPLTGSEPHAATDVHAPDLSDVGAALHTVASDIALSNFDLDHLTSTVDLFNSGHADLGLDTHHS
ncbi:MAG: hypothetical protein JSR99_07105 [Proteobacteria bacterium]|nr:hypothetical protein [Pseudomonadota bacterium]